MSRETVGSVTNSGPISVGMTRTKQDIGRQQTIGIAVLVLLILVSSFATIYSTHACRALYTQLQELESSQWYLQEDYGRLLLEQSTWASHYRVEKVARADLGMAAPDLARFKVVSQ
ncbi:MAG: cell division protein FtsL [Halioglobus sp.]